MIIEIDEHMECITVEPTERQVLAAERGLKKEDIPGTHLWVPSKDDSL